ncbi:MAG: SRPBCC family protein [Parvularculaceae bacterium]
MNEEKSPGISWPHRFHPDVAPIHVRNEIEIAARPEIVFAWLIKAPLWPDWYPNASNVRLKDPNASTLSLDTEFRWKTFGVSIVSRVLEFVPGERIAWDGRAFGVDVYHAWLIRPSAKGAYVVTEESQYGIFARAAAALWPDRMHDFHQIWLERLSEKAAGGMPPAA